MKVCFDTSVIVAASVVGHTHEERSLAWLDAARKGRFDAATSAHALGETWATLTSLPIEPRVAPTAATRLVERVARYLTPLPLRWADYRTAMNRAGDRGQRSGALYDALHLVAAERWGADVFLTFNTRHFTRLTAENGPRIMAPPDPPGLGDLA
jgi:predicted nucleic acid-binding protein